jgi:hypothetical protein
MIDLLELSADAAIELERKINNREFDQKKISCFFEKILVWSPTATHSDLAGRQLVSVSKVANALRKANISVNSPQELFTSLEHLRNSASSSDKTDLETLKQFCLTIARSMQLDRQAKIQNADIYGRHSFSIEAN